jgi:response regulator RpfG family c-di-GMP phosphodiesterase
LAEIFKHNILLVDDEEGILKALARLLRSLGTGILTANSGKEGLEILRKEQVSIIISDQRMPGMEGVDFLSKAMQLSPQSIRVLLTGYADIEATVAAINRGAIKYYFNKPWDDETLLSRVKESLDLYAANIENRQFEELTRRQNELLKILNSDLERRVAEQTEAIRQQRDEIRTSFMETIKAFSAMIGISCKEVGNHSQRVASLVKRLLRWHNLGQKEFHDIIVAAFLHDIGKIGFPGNLSKKQQHELSKNEMEIVSKHPILGQSCVLAISGFEEIGAIIRHHHENYDGSGYPDRLGDHKIPFGARVIRVADAFDKKAFYNGYPNILALNQASAFLMQHSGFYFDPLIVKKFVELDVSNQFVTVNALETAIITSDDLMPGMKVAADIHTGSGMFLAPKGAVLSSGLIKRIAKIDKQDPIVYGIQIYKQTAVKEGLADAKV